MINKRGIILAFSVILLVGFISAQTYEQNLNIDLKISTNETDCQITIESPNSTTLFFNMTMTPQPGFVNYTLNNTKYIGTYQYFINCNDTLYPGTFEVTPSGNPRLNSGEGLIYIGSLAAMILITLLFFFISLNMKSGSLKFGFISLSLIGNIIIILYSAVTLQQVLAGFTKITSGFSTFLYISLFTLLIIFLFVLLALTIEALNNFKKRKGLKEE